MTTDFRALCFELLEWAEFSTSHYYKKPDVIIRARAALAEQPVSQPCKLPTTQPIPVSERLPQVKVILRDIHNPTPQPILACARLPELKDCDADGRCWAYRPFDPRVDDLGDFWQRIPCEWLENFARWTHWLPANALYIPEATND